MCGGKGKRIRSYVGHDMEKPLIKINNKPLVEYLINALIQTERFEKIFAAVSSNTCRTKEFLKEKFHSKITFMETSGTGYSNDYLNIVKYFTNVCNRKNMDLQRILFLPADIPLISSMLLIQIVSAYQKKSCLAIVLEKGYIQNLGFIPTNYEFMIGNKRYCYSGISILDISKINIDVHSDKKVQLLDEEYLILNNIEIACNINTFEDLEIVKKYWKILNQT